MAAERSPTVRRRELGRRLRELRGDQTLQSVADALKLTAATISRIETGARAATRRNIDALCDLYGAEDSLRAQLVALGKQASEQGWWQEYDDLAIDHRLIGLEIEAKRISSHEAANIPWAFQTEEYARAIIKGILPLIDSNVLNERVEVRLTRQKLLKNPNAPHLWSLIDESAFRRSVGGSRVMREQLSKILEVAAAPNVTMQVVPFEAGAHPGLGNSFTLLEFDDPSQPPVVSVENMAGTVYLERQADIKRYREALEYARACAMSPANSTKWVKEIKKIFED
jgi:transcriptional regulator with XRE-family HTH domain